MMASSSSALSRSVKVRSTASEFMASNKIKFNYYRIVGSESLSSQKVRYCWGFLKPNSVLGCYSGSSIENFSWDLEFKEKKEREFRNSIRMRHRQRKV
jgi:hypothetical protein